MNRLFVLAVVLVLGSVVHSQALIDTMPKTENIKVVSRYLNGAVELRWYPVDVASWRKANNSGYTIKRMELSDAGSVAGYKELAVLKVYSTEEWRQKTNTNDNMVKTVMETLKPQVPAAGQSSLDSQNDEGAMFFAYTLATSFSSEAAKGAGLSYTDKAIESGKQYLYAVSINSGKGKKDPDDEALVLVTDTRNNYAALSPRDLSFEEGEGFVKLKWNNTSNQENFVAYYIERSSDGGRTYTTLNTTPFISVAAEETEELTYTDSVKNYIPYQYRIVGLTPWVDKSNPSELVKAMGRDRTPASPPMNTRAKGDRSKILVTWELPAQSRDLKGFVVARAKKLEGPFVAISDKANLIPITQRMFNDIKPSPTEPYYAVYSVDTANNLSSTFSVMASVYDTIGPAKPVGVVGRIDSTGQVNISWKFGNDNDLVGYQVYIANGRDNVFRQVTGSPLVDSVFIDTVSMRSLTREVYYKITSVDYNNNASDYSEVITLQRPDVIPPAAPMISNYAVNDNKVTLTLVPSSSDDVISHQLIRQDASGAKSTLAVLREVRSYIDSSVTEGANYTYTLVANDNSGHRGISSPLSVSITETALKPGVDRFTATWNDREKKAVLQWSLDINGEHELVVFRAGETGEMKAYKKLGADKKSFEDPLISGRYSYAMKVLYFNGAESDLSQPVTVEAK